MMGDKSDPDNRQGWSKLTQTVRILSTKSPKAVNEENAEVISSLKAQNLDSRKMSM